MTDGFRNTVFSSHTSGTSRHRSFNHLKKLGLVLRFAIAPAESCNSDFALLRDLFGREVLDVTTVTDPRHLHG